MPESFGSIRLYALPARVTVCPLTPSENVHPAKPLTSTRGSRAWANIGAEPTVAASAAAIAILLNISLVSLVRFRRSRVHRIGVSTERVGDGGNRPLRAHAVSGVVERRRDDGDAELAR